MRRLCIRAGRNLTRAEWDDLVGSEMGYECTCGQFGPGAGAPPCSPNGRGRPAPVR